MICTSLERPMPVNGESKQWHEQPAIVKSNLKLILVFVKHSYDFKFKLSKMQNWKPYFCNVCVMTSEFWV